MSRCHCVRCVLVSLSVACSPLTLTTVISGSTTSRNINRSLRNYERKISNETVTEQPEDNDVLLAGVSRLRRAGKIHSNDVSEVSDGIRTPDSESVTSDIFGVPDFVREGEESLSERLTRPSYLSSGRLSGTKEEERGGSSRYTSARPVARRSVSRELFDLKYNTGKISPTPYYSSLSETEPLSSALSPVSRRVARGGRDTREGREGSTSREDTADFGLGSGYSRSTSLSRGPDPLSPTRNLPSRPSLASSGRSTTQNEIMRNSPLTVMREEGHLSSGLRDRKRDDWRRISVPERGKDFNSLPRKYTRY